MSFFAVLACAIGPSAQVAQAAADDPAARITGNAGTRGMPMSDSPVRHLLRGHQPRGRRRSLRRAGPNRSFEFNAVRQRLYTRLTAWSGDRGGARHASPVTDDAAAQRPTNRNYLRLNIDRREPGAADGVRNAGFNTGIAVEAGETYDFSVWARRTAPPTDP